MNHQKEVPLQVRGSVYIANYITVTFAIMHSASLMTHCLNDFHVTYDNFHTKRVYGMLCDVDDNFTGRKIGDGYDELY